MRQQGTTVPDLELLRRANSQVGLLRGDDLHGAGLTPSAIARRTASGRLTRIHVGVYAFGHTALRDEAVWLAAQWAYGEGAVLSHLSAAAFHGWRVDGSGRDPVHLTTTGARRSREGVVVHRVRRLDRVDVFRSGLFVVTTIPRTFVDLADVLTWEQFREIADGQASLRLDKIREAQRRAPNRRGSPLVARLIEADDAHTKSEFERRFLQFAAAHGIPRPDGVNERVAGHKADCVYRERRLVLELDGRAFHTRRRAFAADRRRDTDYQLAGFRIMRLVWDDLHPQEAPRTARRLRAMLAAAPACGDRGT